MREKRKCILQCKYNNIHFGVSTIYVTVVCRRVFVYYNIMCDVSRVRVQRLSSPKRLARKTLRIGAIPAT